MSMSEWLESVRPPAWTIPADLVSGQVGEWVEVVRLDQLRGAVAAACRCGCSADMHIGEIGCPCGLPGETPCAYEPTAAPPEPKPLLPEVRDPAAVAAREHVSTSEESTS